MNRLFLLAAAAILAACSTMPEQESSGAISLEGLLRASSAERLSFADAYPRRLTNLPQEAPRENHRDKRSEHASIAELVSGQASTPVMVQTENSFGFVEQDGLMVHSQTGLICPPFFGIETDDVKLTFGLTEVRAFAADGTDVACNFVTEDNTTIMTVFASYWPDMSSDDHMLQALQQTAQTFDSPRAIPVPLISVEPDGENLFDGPTDAAAIAFGSRRSQRGQTAVFLRVVDDWHVKVRVTTLQSSDEPIIAAAIWHQVNALAIHDYLRDQRLDSSA